MFGRDFKIFKVGSDNKADGITAVLELDIDSVGFSDNLLLFEIKLLSGVSHEFKCANGDDYSQWKRALSDYCGLRSSAVETVTFAGFAKKLLCMFAQEQVTEGLGQLVGPGDVGDTGDVKEDVGVAQSEDEEEEDFAGDAFDIDLGGGNVDE
jgi:hypothetical protein